MKNIQTQLNEFVLPAEWEPQSGVQLTWPHEGTDWKPYLHDIINTEVALAKAIARYEKVIIVTQDVEKTKRHFSSDELNQIHFYCYPINDTWARDHGFITLLPRTAGKVPQLLDFKFNGWGEKFEASDDNRINGHLYQDSTFKGEYSDQSDLVLEGGSIESDGKGTILTTSLCLLAPHRNQPLTREDLENQLKERLHADRVLWVEHGQLIGDDTDGHIDTTVRFAPDDTLVYVGCDDRSDPQYKNFKAMEDQLKTFRTRNGKPYRLLRLPMPDVMMDGDERLPATYANFLVINGAVIYPTYHQPEKDRLAGEIIQEAFPERDIIAIDASTVVRQHGSLHCLTMQFPENIILS